MPSAADPDELATVGAVAASLGVTVRALHHWDAIGLASPSRRTSGGYRAYDPADVALLRRIVLLRELGVPLAGIRTLLSAGADERRAELMRRRAELDERIARLQEVAAAVDRLIAADATGPLLPADKATEVFGEDWDPAWTTGARERWGDSPQWAEYAERAAERDADDWRAVVGELEEVLTACAEAFAAGIRPEDGRAAALVERHRQAMSAYFHCTPSMHVIMAQTFSGEHAAHYDGYAPGLGEWLRAAVEASARARGIDPARARWE
ncbi:MerR family transcriptional regulator [Microbacterium resistens]